MKDHTFLGIKLNSTATSALLIQEAMAGQPDSLWVELFSMLLEKPGYHQENLYWVSVFQSQEASQNTYIRYAANALLKHRRVT
jgi:hypothetical protein